MRATIHAVALVGLIGGAVVGPVTAEPRYDRKLEQAAMAIVAARIGDIRGGFALEGRPAMVVASEGHAEDSRVAAAERLPDGLQRAVEKPVDPGAMF